MRYLLIVCALSACAHPPVAAVPRPPEPWTETTVYRLNLADEAVDERTFAATDTLEAPEEWVARPEQAPRDWPLWLAQMSAHHITSFDFSALDHVEWGALPTMARLSLVGFRLDADARAFIAQASHLVWLDLARTNIDDAVCADIAHLSQLQYLSLAETHVSDACVAAIAHLPRLERLNLAKAPVGDAGVATLVALPLLSDLVLNGTHVTDASVTRLLARFALKRLDLNDTAVARTNVARTTSFERLDLGDTHVTAKIVQSLTRHPYLRFLSLAGVALDDKALSTLAQLHRLEVLDLTNTDIRAIASLGNLERLESLSIAKTTVTDLAVLTHLPRLRFLDISTTPIDDLSAVAVLPMLAALNASHTSIASLAPLRTMRTLRVLHLAGTGIDDRALADLAAFPDLDTLSLSECGLLDLSALGALTHLKNLAIARVSFITDSLRLPASLEALNATGSSLDSLSALPLSVRGLRLAGTALTDFASLARFHRLSVLDVSGLPITDADLPTHAELPNLKQLNVRDTHITPQGLAARGF